VRPDPQQQQSAFENRNPPIDHFEFIQNLRARPSQIWPLAVHNR
jgi:hypothetical protein